MNTKNPNHRKMIWVLAVKITALDKLKA